MTKSVIEDFEQDNTKYLELRSTPRANPETGAVIIKVSADPFTRTMFINHLSQTTNGSINSLLNGIEDLSPFIPYFTIV